MCSGEGLNSSIEVPLISEQAGACDLFFHLFFCIPFQEGKQPADPTQSESFSFSDEKNGSQDCLVADHSAAH